MTMFKPACQTILLQPLARGAPAISSPVFFSCASGVSQWQDRISIMTTTNRPLALVPGASGGIGADLARELARDGQTASWPHAPSSPCTPLPKN